MKAKLKEEKEKIKLRYAAALGKALADNGFSSFRQLALSIGLEPAHIQRISVGKVDVVLTTAIALAEGLGISYADLAGYYDDVTEKDIQEFIEKREKGRRKKPAVAPKRVGEKNAASNKSSIVKKKSPTKRK